MQRTGYWFKSDLFGPEPGEEAETNPGIYGKQLAQWLAAQLRTRGYPAPEVIAEDWGWCVICAREPFWLWVGCGSMAAEDPPDEAAGTVDITWHCFPVAEVPFWQRLFRRVDAAPALARLHAELGAVLAAEPAVRLVEEP